ncbi:MAG: hypothetical protein ACLS8Q_08310 [Anaerovoracaceae bacterium]
MKRKKFFLDPKIVLKKKDMMMEKQIKEFSRVFGEFERSREYYCAQLGDNERLKIGFEEEGKFAAKFFSTYIVLEMEDVHMNEAWEARLEFRGSMRITDLVWKPVKKDHRPVVEKLNLCAEFNSKLLDIAGSFDLVTVELKYLHDSKTLIVKIFPYAGTYVWVKIPPAHYEILLNNDEIDCIYKIVELYVQEFEQSMEG